MGGINWVITSVAALLTTFGALIFGGTIWLVASRDDSNDLLSLIPLGLGIILLGLLLLMRTRIEREVQHLLLKALLHGVVGCGLILFWWVLIERPKITHQDIQELCRAIMPDEEQSRACYYHQIMK